MIHQIEQMMQNIEPAVVSICDKNAKTFYKLLSTVINGKVAHAITGIKSSLANYICYATPRAHFAYSVPYLFPPVGYRSWKNGYQEKNSKWIWEMFRIKGTSNIGNMCKFFQNRESIEGITGVNVKLINRLAIIMEVNTFVLALHAEESGRNCFVGNDG